MMTLSREHYRRRLERLRTLLICTADPAEAERLRAAIERYRVLELHAPQLAEAFDQFNSDLDRMIEKARDSKVDLMAVADLLYRRAEDLRLSARRLFGGGAVDPGAGGVERLGDGGLHLANETAR
jgi:hypothetical protein